MKNVASMDVELKVEERNLLSVAYKNVIGARRASWRIISSIEHREEGKSNEEKMKLIQGYRQTVKRSVNIICCPRGAENLCLDSDSQQLIYYIRLSSLNLLCKHIDKRRRRLLGREP